MKKEDFNYYLPDELIAQEPIMNRDFSNLLVIDKSTGNLEHRKFKDIINFLDRGDCIVLNDTKVLPARLIGNKKTTEGKIEFVLLNNKGQDIWEVILKPGKRAKIGSEFIFGEGKLKAEIIDILEGGNRLVKFNYDNNFEEVLNDIGIMPLPPYIKKNLDDKTRYQTVYSKFLGSAAAPTAGLHFTKELLDEILKKEIRLAFITLHVGLGTFRPVKASNIHDHKMHKEYFNIDSKNADIINNTKNNGKKIIAVGTTTSRVLETVSDDMGYIEKKTGWTDIFIYPGYKFKVVDNLITNFHLPESTLIMLVSALAGKDNILKAYNEAVEMKYRFFSFGDAMFIK
ncbi:MAG: tRNA preQ1(34) S-adenosylmethionine ribosyltransferase-isomerase QueA [Clostridiales bacterium]